MTSSAPGTEPTAEGGSVFRYRRAFERHRDAIAAIKDDDLVTINTDIPTSIVVAIGAWPEVQALLPALDEMLRTYDRPAVVELDERARAAGYANNLFLVATAPVERIPELVAKLTPVRELFLSDIRGLQKRKLIDPRKLENITQGPFGHKELAFDIMVLAQIFREHLTALAGKTPVTEAEIEQAELDADDLSNAVAIKEGGPSVATEAAKTRHRAYTYFFNAYDEARRVITCLRWREDDVDKIVPSLYAGRGGRGRRGKEVPPPAPATTPPVTPAPSPQAEAERAPGTGLPGNRPF